MNNKSYHPLRVTTYRLLHLHRYDLYSFLNACNVIQ
jgi:hypothetical protein